MDFDPDKMRARFHDLTAKAVAVRAKADPIRAKRDNMQVRHAKEAAKANTEVAKAEKGLFEIEQERAMIARALGGRVGEPE